MLVPLITGVSFESGLMMEPLKTLSPAVSTDDSLARWTIPCSLLAGLKNTNYAAGTFC